MEAPAARATSMIVGLRSTNFPTRLAYCCPNPVSCVRLIGKKMITLSYVIVSLYCYWALRLTFRPCQGYPENALAELNRGPQGPVGTTKCSETGREPG
jgi:hypothetical protein